MNSFFPQSYRPLAHKLSTPAHIPHPELVEGNKSLHSQWPWQEDARTATLLDIMQRLEGFIRDDTFRWFLETEELVSHVRGMKSVPDEIKTSFSELLFDFKNRLRDMGLPVTQQIVSLLAVAQQEKHTDFTPERLSDRLLDIDRTFRAELGTHVFVHLDEDKARFFEKEKAWGKEIAEAFPSIAYDLVEACTCYSLNRSTACVFHLMRVLEVPIECIKKQLAMTGTYPSWGGFLVDMAKANRAKDPSKNSEEFLFFADLESQLWAIKNAWRDETMHSVASKYTEGGAQIIFRAVEGLLKRLH